MDDAFGWDPASRTLYVHIADVTGALDAAGAAHAAALRATAASRGASLYSEANSALQRRATGGGGANSKYAPASGAKLTLLPPKATKAASFSPQRTNEALSLAVRVAPPNAARGEAAGKLGAWAPCVFETSSLGVVAVTASWSRRPLVMCHTRQSLQARGGSCAP